MITIKLELDPGDGKPPQTTTVQVDPDKLPQVKRALHLVAMALKHDPKELVQRIGAYTIGQAVGRGLQRILTPKPK